MLSLRLLSGVLVIVASVCIADSVSARPQPKSIARREEHAVTKWLDSNPHTPLAVSDRKGVRAPPIAACNLWATRGSRWLALDRWGAVAGEAVVGGGEYYNVTQCTEPTMRLLTGSATTGLYVSAAPGWHAPTSAEWVPTKTARADLKNIIAGGNRMLRRRFPPIEPPLIPFDERAVFFRMPPATSVNDQDAGTRWAVVGGTTLSVFELDPKEGWLLSHLIASEPMASRNAFKPLAIIDMDGDGYPEIIVHRSSGTSWDDIVLGVAKSNWPRSWKILATSIGGSTA